MLDSNGSLVGIQYYADIRVIINSNVLLVRIQYCPSIRVISHPNVSLVGIKYYPGIRVILKSNVSLVGIQYYPDITHHPHKASITIVSLIDVVQSSMVFLFISEMTLFYYYGHWRFILFLKKWDTFCIIFQFSIIWMLNSSNFHTYKKKLRKMCPISSEKEINRQGP